jgi:NAD(P)-dependent dehydrogenase (short-subunit alcohol dehydrogenase family)
MKDTLCRHLSNRGKAAFATTLGKDDTMSSQPRTFLITGASKGIGRALSVRLAGAGHRVVGLARGADPEFPGELYPVGSAGEARYLAGVPMRRFGRPDEVAAAIAFLMSEDAAFITGQTLFIDGGASIGRAAL